MTPTVSELRIPADPQYIVVAKRAATAFAYIAGFGVEAVDELSIAIAQACENAIRCTGGGPGQIRMTFRLEDQRLEVRVASSCKAEEALELRGEEEREAVHDRPAEPRVPARAAAAAGGAAEQQRMHDLAMRMMGLFVDDCRWRVDQRTGGLRVRLTKYRIS